jgi:hypothetical protein
MKSLVPPRLVRRLVVAPLVVLVCLLFVVLGPLLLLAAFVVDVVQGTRRGLTRLTAFSIVFAAAEGTMILALFGLWIVSGFGLLRLGSAHFALLRGWLRVLSFGAKALLGLKIVVLDAPEPRSGPLLVFGRHAGLGNSVMMIRQLMVRFDRRPRVVMLAFLQWDPVADIVCHRLPSLFIDHDPEHSDEYVRKIGDLARGMGDRDAFVLYPEGNDFTERLRLRAIAYLRRKGHNRAAERAEAMERVLPPRHRGPLAAIQAAPEADVVLVAHTALEELGSFAELYRKLPLERPVKARYWRIPAGEVPHEEEPLIEWLYEWWQVIDDWVDEHAPESAKVPA